MKLTIGLVFTTAFFQGLSALTLAGSGKTNVVPSLKLIAIADGKFYFTDNISTGNWTQAGDFCGNLSMKLASISSQAQADALELAYSTLNFEYSAYWTSGMDAQERRQFTWNSTGEAFSEIFPKFRHPKIEHLYQTCVLYDSKPNRQSTLVYYECDYVARFLCEITSCEN